MSDLSLSVPLSKSQHSEINLETKTKVRYHICLKKKDHFRFAVEV